MENEQSKNGMGRYQIDKIIYPKNEGTLNAYMAHKGSYGHKIRTY